MRSEVIPPSPKHHRQRQARSSAACPDRMSYWRQTTPSLRPTRSDGVPLSRSRLRQTTSSFAANLHRIPCRQSRQVEPLLPANPNLALRAQAPQALAPHPRPAMALAAAKRARQSARPTAHLRRLARASPHQAVSSRDHRQPSAARTPYSQAISNAISAKRILRDDCNTPHRIDRCRSRATRITDFGKKNGKNTRYFTESSHRSAKSTLSALLFVAFATKSRGTEPAKPIGRSFR